MLDAEVQVSVRVDVAMPAPPGLLYVCDSKPAIRRRRAGKGFVYLDAEGRRMSGSGVLASRGLRLRPLGSDTGNLNGFFGRRYQFAGAQPSAAGLPAKRSSIHGT